MAYGQMDRQITIQQKTTARDAYGEPIETWTTLATVYAEWIPQSGQEFWQNQHTLATLTATYRIHYRADVTPLMRIVDGSRNYEIVEAEEDRRFGYKEFLLIRAKAVRG